jgi:hypothetical protein
VGLGIIVAFRLDFGKSSLSFVPVAELDRRLTVKDFDDHGSLPCSMFEEVGQYPPAIHNTSIIGVTEGRATG